MKKPYVTFERESDGQILMGFADYDLQLPRKDELVDVGVFGFRRVIDVVHYPSTKDRHCSIVIMVGKEVKS